MTLSEWKGFSVTQEIMGELRRRQAEAKEYLAYNAGNDPLKDRWYTGVIAAYEDMLNIELEETHDN